jgi:hypothetical protein
MNLLKSINRCGLTSINSDYDQSWPRLVKRRPDNNVATVMQMGLTVIVPYLVSTASSVGAIREARATLRAQAQQLGQEYRQLNLCAE